VTSRRTALLLALLTAAPCGAARAELGEVWAVDDGTKVRGDALLHPLRAGNAIFSREARRVRLFGLRNETVAFQVLLCGGAASTPGVQVRLAEVGSIRNGAVKDDPDRYFLDRHIELFEEHYLTITRRSHERLPPGFDGPVPDALIPLRRPLAVPARMVRGVWVDLYIPRDARAGLHRGELRVEVDGRTCSAPGCRLEVELEVLPLAIPERPAMRTMLWFSGATRDAEFMPARYLRRGVEHGPAEYVALRRRHHHLARRHRVTLFAEVDGPPDDELDSLISGRAFTRAAGYAGPGEGVGQDMYSIHTYGIGPLSSSEARVWADWFATHGPGVEYFLYTIDEPHDPAIFPRLNAMAREARPVPAFVTAAFQPGLDLDIYTTSPKQYSVAVARRATALGKRVWIYNGDPFLTGTFFTDDTAISMRVNPWLQWRYRIPRWFYWESTYYISIHDKRRPNNVWRDAMTFSNKDGDYLNGDGVLFYPGRDLIFPEEDRGFDGPFPSIRLKNWRRGLQDVDYLELARGAGLGSFAEALAARLVPRGLDETTVEEPPSWPEDGERWLTARRLLFEALKTGKAREDQLGQVARPPERLASRARRAALLWTKGWPRRAGLAAGVVAVIVLAFVLVDRRRRRRRLSR